MSSNPQHGHTKMRHVHGPDIVAIDKKEEDGDVFTIVDFSLLGAWSEAGKEWLKTHPDNWPDGENHNCFTETPTSKSSTSDEIHRQGTSLETSSPLSTSTCLDLANG